MVFYKIEAVKLSDGSQKGLSRQEHRARANVIAEKSEGFFQKGDQRYLIFVVSILEEKVTIGCICKGKEKVDELLKKYAKLLPFEIESFKIEESAKEKLLDIFDSVLKSSDFGNGRYVRNVIEKAKMAQADRLVKMDFEKITEEDVFTLVADDFELQNKKPTEKEVKIGFCA